MREIRLFINRNIGKIVLPSISSYTKYYPPPIINLVSPDFYCTDTYNSNTYHIFPVLERPKPARNLLIFPHFTPNNPIPFLSDPYFPRPHSNPCRAPKCSILFVFYALLCAQRYMRDHICVDFSQGLSPMGASLLLKRFYQLVYGLPDLFSPSSNSSVQLSDFEHNSANNLFLSPIICLIGGSMRSVVLQSDGCNV